MVTIYKYPVPITDRFELDLPLSAVIGHFGMSGPSAYLWIELDSNCETQAIGFRIFGTGRPIESYHDLKYVGTVTDNPRVWHLYQEL